MKQSTGKASSRFKINPVNNNETGKILSIKKTRTKDNQRKIIDIKNVIADITNPM